MSTLASTANRLTSFRAEAAGLLGVSYALRTVLHFHNNLLVPSSPYLANLHRDNEALVKRTGRIRPPVLGKRGV